MLEVLPITTAEPLYRIAHQTILDLASPEGINASGRNEIFGCIFGRDSAITILKILKAHQRKPVPDLLPICRRSLLNLVSLQGTQFNIESGEEPGKFIHEYRLENHEHLTSHPNQPWYLYPDEIMRNYDSVDATPLGLIALYRYWETTQDNEFLVTVLPAVEAGLNWIITFGDLDKDFLLEYQFHPARKFGGLSVQSWTDSREALLDLEGKFPLYPIAPIEVQGFAWLALKLWGDHYTFQYPEFAQKISSFADQMQKSFDKQFILKNSGLFYGAQALTGNKEQIKTITGNPLLLLWASSHNECILDQKLIPDFVNRALKPLFHFGCPIELHHEKNDKYFEYRSPSGQTGCKYQAWSAAALLDMTV